MPRALNPAAKNRRFTPSNLANIVENKAETMPILKP
jgi:hypothetical protein